MGQCVICGKPEEQLTLFNGIVDGKVRKVCYNCSLDENIALIQKPTKEQLENAQKRQSVRELMEKISTPQKRIMKTDSAIAHKNMVKIRFPSAKQEHGDLVQNYDWIMKQARRRMKYSIGQVSELTGIEKAQLESLEAGQLFQGFEKVARAVEKVLDIKITRFDESVPQAIVHLDKQQLEEHVVEDVKEKMKKPWWSFFKKERKDEQINPEELNQELQATPEEVKQIEFVQEKPKLSPWREAREKQKRGEVVSHPNRIISQTAKMPETPIRMNAVKSESIQHGKIDVASIRKEKEDQKSVKIEDIESQIEEGDFDFSDKKTLDKITIQDLAELKKKRENQK